MMLCGLLRLPSVTLSSSRLSYTELWLSQTFLEYQWIDTIKYSLIFPACFVFVVTFANSIHSGPGAVWLWWLPCVGGLHSESDEIWYTLNFMYRSRDISCTIYYHRWEARECSNCHYHGGAKWGRGYASLYLHSQWEWEQCMAWWSAKRWFSNWGNKTSSSHSGHHMLHVIRSCYTVGHCVYCIQHLLQEKEVSTH